MMVTYFNNYFDETFYTNTFRSIKFVVFFW